MVKGKRFIWLICLFFLAGFQCRAHGTEIDQKISSVELEQARVYMPEIRVYFYPASSEDLDQEKIRASLAGEKLEVQGISPVAEETQGTSYYMLVDISASIGDTYFSHIRQAVENFQKGMEPADTLTLITFGNEVTVLFENAAPGDDCSELIQGMENDDQTTLLLEALKKTAEMADTEAGNSRRTVFIIITDGEDFSKDATRNEALVTLQKRGIPLYALAVEEMAGGEENQFTGELGEFARETGGQLQTFGSEEAEEAMEQQQERLKSAYVLSLMAATNRVTSQAQSLDLVFGTESAVRTLMVYPKYYQKDETAPLAEAEQLSSKELMVRYSEPVQNGGDADHFQIMAGGERIRPERAEYRPGDSPSTLLTFSEDLAEGEYEISFIEIYDESMEENLLTDVCTLTVGTPELQRLDAENPTEAESDEAESESEPQTDIVILSSEEAEEEEKDEINWLFLLIPAAVIAFLAILTALLITRKKKKGQGKEGSSAMNGGKEDSANTAPFFGDKGQNQPEGEHSPVPVTEKAKPEPYEPPVLPKEILYFDIQMQQGVNTVEVPFQGRVTVGRSQKCSVSFDDARMSREHFLIEKSGESYYIEDLETTNGTMVNGVKIQHRRSLEKGDMIYAGSVQMRIRW